MRISLGKKLVLGGLALLIMPMISVGDTLDGVMKGKSFAGEEYFQKASAGQTVIGHIGGAQKSGEPLVMIAAPLLYQGHNMGVAVVGWRTKSLDEKMSAIRIGKAGFAAFFLKKCFPSSSRLSPCRTDRLCCRAFE